MPMLKLLPILALIGLAATGCAAQRQQEQQAAIAEANTYCKTLEARAELDPIRDKLAIGGSPSFQQLADRTTPSPNERSAIAALGGLTKLCADRLTATLNQHAPGLTPPLQAATGRAQAAFAQLYNSEITYGQANAAIAENQHMLGQAVANHQAAVSQQEAARNAAIAAAIGQGFRNAANSYGQAAQNYRTSSCRWMGSTWTCSSF